MKSFNINEIFAIAEAIEDNGASFYRDTAEKFKNDEQLYKLLKQLEAEEIEHKKIFRKYKEKYASKKDSYREDLDTTAIKYINAIASQYVFNLDRIKKMAKDVQNRYDLFNFAIDREKDAILFYLGLKDLMDTTEEMKALEAMIKEEQRHLYDLTRHKEGK